MEILRPLGVWRWIIGAILLIITMIYKPGGLAGGKELSIKGIVNFVDTLKNRITPKTKFSVENNSNSGKQ